MLLQFLTPLLELLKFLSDVWLVFTNRTKEAIAELADEPSVLGVILG